MLLNLFNSSKNSSYTVAIANDALMQVVMDQVLETFPRHNLSPSQSKVELQSRHSQMVVHLNANNRFQVMLHTRLNNCVIFSK